MIQTFLSDEIQYMLVIKSESKEFNSLKFRTESNSIDWDNVRQYFKRELVFHNQPLPYEYCAALTPKFHKFLQTFNSIPPPKHLQWTNRLDLLNSSFLPQKSCTLSNLLILTSIVEYSLGNLYQTETGSAPPHLLRDLLMTDVLANLLGEITIYLLRVLLGSPNGINLRNLVWHGFPREGELCEMYGNFLLEMLDLIGLRLMELKYEVQFRSCMLNSKQLISKMNLTQFDVRLLEEAVNGGSIDLQEIQKESWLRILALYKEEQFYRCVCMALPQLEMSLRILYARLYSKDFLAKIDEYYIIMDTVLEEFEPTTEARNRIHDYFASPILEAMYDLFSAIRGPRLRDKLSHGELQLADIDELVANRVLLLSYVILINDPTFQYKSCFHHNAILEQSILDCELEFDKCNRLKVSTENEKVFQNVPFLPQAELNQRILIFYRPDKEEEIVGYLQRITTKLQLSASNLNESLTVRLESLANRELRSRTRKSLETMLQMYPVILQGLTYVLRIVTWTFYCLMASDELRQEDKLIRFLKFILKYVENAANNLNIKSNAWQPLYETTRRELYDKTRQNLTLLLC